MNHMRQVDIFDPTEFDKVRVGVIGIGNIGSHVTLTLARMGIQNFILWDDDKVEEHNLSSQAYGLDHLGKFKTDAVADQVVAFNKEIKVITYPSKFELPLNTPVDIYIIGVDSLEARREICAELLKLNTQPVIIDGRIGGEQLEVYTCTNAQEWEKTIPDKASEEPCGARYIAYVSVMIGGIITAQVKKVLSGQDYPKSFLMNMGNYDTLKQHEW